MLVEPFRQSVFTTDVHSIYQLKSAKAIRLGESERSERKKELVNRGFQERKTLDCKRIAHYEVSFQRTTKRYFFRGILKMSNNTNCLDSIQTQ